MCSELVHIKLCLRRQTPCRELKQIHIQERVAHLVDIFISSFEGRVYGTECEWWGMSALAVDHRSPLTYRCGCVSPLLVWILCRWNTFPGTNLSCDPRVLVSCFGVVVVNFAGIQCISHMACVVSRSIENQSFYILSCFKISVNDCGIRIYNHMKGLLHLVL